MSDFHTRRDMLLEFMSGQLTTRSGIRLLKQASRADEVMLADIQASLSDYLDPDWEKFSFTMPLVPALVAAAGAGLGYPVFDDDSLNSRNYPGWEGNPSIRAGRMIADGSLWPDWMIVWQYRKDRNLGFIGENHRIDSFIMPGAADAGLEGRILYRSLRASGVDLAQAVATVADALKAPGKADTWLASWRHARGGRKVRTRQGAPARSH